MNPESVRKQIKDLFSRLLTTSFSVKQRFPACRKTDGGGVEIGGGIQTAIALKDVAYEDVYLELESHDAYHVKLIDGGLLQFQYSFDSTEALQRHRLAYFPSPVLPAADEAPELYERDNLYGDILARRLVRFPIRFDYVPQERVDIFHPASHLTLGQYESCRIPVAGPIGPSSFGIFIIRNFYFRLYKRFKNEFDRRPVPMGRVETISKGERRMTHVVHGR